MTDSLHEVLATLGVSQASALFAPHWEQSMACLPHEPPPFLARAGIGEICHYAGLDGEVESRLCETAESVCESPALLRLAWHCSRLAFEHLDYGADQLSQWPDLDHVLPERSGLFYLLIALDMASRTRARHQELGVAEGITRASCTNLRIHAERHKLATGRWGTLPRLLFWLRYHTMGELFRLGRFQFMIKPFRGQLSAYRHRDTAAVVALTNDGVRYTQEGWMLRGEDTGPLRSKRTTSVPPATQSRHSDTRCRSKSGSTSLSGSWRCARVIRSSRCTFLLVAA